MRGLSRRALLRLVAAGGLGAGLAGIRRLVGPDPVPARVVVVGGGLAGLCAAYELVRRGADVLVLEGRERPGGRVLTVREPFEAGQYVDVGASRIPDSHRLTLRYVDHFGLELEPFDPDTGDSVDYTDGRAVRVPARASATLGAYPYDVDAADRELAGDAVLGKYFLSVLSELGDLGDPSWPGREALALDRQTALDLARERGIPRYAVDYLSLGTFDPDRSRTSILFLLLFSLGLPSTRRLKIRGGSDLLPRAFADRLGARVVYGAKVVRIARDDRGVRVVYVRDGGEREVAGDFGVLAIPFPVARGIEFSPALSPRKREAIESLRFRAVARASVQVGRRVWEADGLNGFARTDLPSEIWHPTFTAPGPQGILHSYIKGRPAEELAALAGERPRLQRCVGHIASVFPGIEPRITAQHLHLWHRDPFSLGAYATFSVGQVEALRPHLAPAEGRIHFAGDHTSIWTGWMQGAFESALRVVDEISRRVTA